MGRGTGGNSSGAGSCRCETCDNNASVTLKGFSKEDGTEIWQHRLDSPLLSTDGYIYGYGLEETASTAAKACTVIPLYSLTGGFPLRVAYNPAVRRFRKWVRKIDLYGNVIGDSTFFWYTGNASSNENILELPDKTIGFMQDLYGVTSTGDFIQMQGDNSTGAMLFGGEGLIAWDDNNSTTIRKYTIVAAAIRNLASPPTGAAKMRFVAENDGTNAETTVDVINMIGKTASTLASDLVASFPHIASATGTGGPYPLVNIELTITWNQSTTHFKTVRRLEATCRSYRTWLRDWDTAAINLTVDTPGGGSVAAQWCLTDSDDIIGWNPNTLTGIGFETGTYFEKYVSGSRVWRVGPTLGNPPRWGLDQVGQTKAFYKSPSFRNGRMFVTHSTARGNGQAAGDHSEWHEIDLSSGALIGTGGKNDRFAARLTFASDDRLFYAAGDNGVFDSAGVSIEYASEAYRPDFCGLTTTVAPSTDHYDYEYACPYGPDPHTADLTALYSFAGPLLVGPQSAGLFNYRSTAQLVVNQLDNRIATMYGIYTIGGSSRVAPDGFFSLQSYYRLQFQFMSPANAYWLDSGMEWRVAFFTSSTITQTSTPTMATSWLSFSADRADMENALRALLGNNDAGPNAFVGTEPYPITSDDVCPQMIWQRGVLVTIPSEVPVVPWHLPSRDDVLYLRIQVRAAVANKFVRSTQYVHRIDWATGNVIWERPWGYSAYGGGVLAGRAGTLSEDLYIVAGEEAKGTCYCVYQWQETGYGYGTEAWILVADYCTTGKTPTPPAGVGAFVGQYKNGTCA